MSAIKKPSAIIIILAAVLAVSLGFNIAGLIPPSPKIILKERSFKNDDIVRYEFSVPSKKIDRVIHSGLNPKITLHGKCSGPVVAVLLARSDYFKDGYSIAKNDVNALTDNGLCPVFISHDNINEQLVAAKPSGILLPGGSFKMLHEDVLTEFDFDPPYRDLKKAYAYRIMLDYAKFHNLPTLGICAGHQMIASFLGGKLVGYINEGEVEINHKDVPAARHEIIIRPDTLLANIISEESLSVNTSHNSAISGKIEGAYTVSAISPDGIIEAIEPHLPWADFVLGVQWHPESLFNDNILDESSKNIFSAFADSVKRRSNLQVAK